MAQVGKFLMHPNLLCSSWATRGTTHTLHTSSFVFKKVCQFEFLILSKAQIHVFTSFPLLLPHFPESRMSAPNAAFLTFVQVQLCDGSGTYALVDPRHLIITRSYYPVQYPTLSPLTAPSATSEGHVAPQHVSPAPTVSAESQVAAVATSSSHKSVSSSSSTASAPKSFAAAAEEEKFVPVVSMTAAKFANYQSKKAELEAAAASCASSDDDDEEEFEEKKFSRFFQSNCKFFDECDNPDCKRNHHPDVYEFAETPLKERCSHGDWNNDDCIKWCPYKDCKKVHHPSTDRTPIKCPFEKKGGSCARSSGCSRNVHEGDANYSKGAPLEAWKKFQATVFKPKF